MSSSGITGSQVSTELALIKTKIDALTATLAANPNQNLSQFKIQGTSRSRAGVSSFSDVQEESYYKYAQAQNLVRYLYAAKSRYKNMTKGKS